MKFHSMAMFRCPIEWRRRTPPGARNASVRSGMVVAAIIAMQANLVGCSAESTKDPARAPTQTLTIGVRNLQAQAAPLYWAQAKGYFEEAGVDLELVVGEAAQTAQLVAGQIDLFWGGPQGSLFGIINSGKTVHTIYGTDAGANSYVVTSNDAVRTPADCVTVTTAPAGTVMHAYTKQIERAYGIKWDLTQLTTIPAILANVAAGRTDCAIGSISYYQSAIDEGRLRVIANPADPLTLPPEWPRFGVEAVAGGLPETLERNRAAIESVLAVYNTALRDFKATDPHEIAQTLLNADRGWVAAGSADAIATALGEFKQFLSPDDGFISEDAWSATVTFFRDGGLSFMDTDQSRFNYSNAVDMSFFESAIGQP